MKLDILGALCDETLYLLLYRALLEHQCKYHNSTSEHTSLHLQVGRCEMGDCHERC